MAKKLCKAAVLFGVLFCLIISGIALFDNFDAGVYLLDELPYFEFVIN